MGSFSSKMKRFDPNKQPLTQAELQELAENLSSGEEYYSSDDEAEHDNLVENVSESEDEIEFEDEVMSEEEPIPSDDDNPQCSSYTAKSGLEWSSQPFPRTRRLQRNILNVRPGITPLTASANTILEVFNLFLTVEIKNIICLRTNEEACKYYEAWNKKNPTNKKREWASLEGDELDSFLGILITAGALRCRKESTREMWTTKTSIRRSFFTAAMPRDRFEKISTFLRFDDKLTRAERKELDKLAAIREVWDKFVDNCRKCFEPYEHITIDEQLVCFRGKCPFRQYIKSKPGRYGIKIWAAADVKTSYLCNLQVYTGKLSGGIAERNQGFRVVSDLAHPYHGSWRGITTDNFFTSVSLGNYLLTKQLTLLGTVRKNKPDTPPQLNISSRPEKSSMFAFRKDLAMVSYIPKKKRMVHLLSSQHTDDKIAPESDNKPYMILDYNSTKGGVDNSDKLIREYSCNRRTARWPYRLFMNIVDICCLNAFVVFIEKNPEWKKQNTARRRCFMLQLGNELALKNMEKRASFANNKSYVKSALKDCGINVDGRNQISGCNTNVANSAKKRARCYQCPRQKDKKVNTTCSQCNKFICEEHRIKQTHIVCTNCMST